MKIAYVCTDPGVPVFGCKGASVHVQEVLRSMARRGHEITLAAARIDGDPPAGLEKIRVVPLPRPGGVDGESRERALLEANTTTRAALERVGPVDLIYERHALWSFGAMEHARETGTPSALEVNAPLVEEQARFRGLARRGEAEAAAARAFAAAGTIFCVSGAVRDAVVAAGAAGDKTEVLPNGVDADRFHPGVPPRLPANNGGMTVGFVGTLKPWHGIDVLLAAFERLVKAGEPGPAWRLLVVGDGPLLPAARQWLGERGLLDRAVFTGAVKPDDVPAWVTSLDIAAAPYPPESPHYFSPLKLYEYMAAGRAIVASRIGQTEQVIEHGRTGMLSTPGDADALAEAIGTLGQDAGVRAELGGAARRQALERHTWRRVVDRVFARCLPAHAESAAGDGI